MTDPRPTGYNRRHLLASGLAAAAALAAGFPRPALAQGQKLTFKLGTDLPVPHPVNVRLKEAIAAIAQETNGAVEISLFPSNQLGSDSDMLSQIRSGALELATFPGTVVSTLVPATSLTGIGFAFTSYDKVWAAMDGEVGGYIRKSIEKAARTLAMTCTALMESPPTSQNSSKTPTASKPSTSIQMSAKRASVSDRGDRLGVLPEGRATARRAARSSLPLGSRGSLDSKSIDAGIM